MRALLLCVLVTSSAAAQTSPAEAVAAWPEMTEAARYGVVQAASAGEWGGPTLADDPAGYAPFLSLALGAKAVRTRGVALTILSFGAVGVRRGMIDPETFDVLKPSVVRSTRAEDARERAVAYGALLAFDGPEVTDALVAGVRDLDGRVVEAALGAVYVLGSTVRPALLTAVLDAQGGAAAGAAVLALGALFRDADALPAAVEGALRVALRGRPYVQQEALGAVADVGPGAAGLRPDVEAIAAAPPEGWGHLGPNAGAALRRLDGARSARDPVLR